MVNEYESLQALGIRLLTFNDVSRINELKERLMKLQVNNLLKEGKRGICIVMEPKLTLSIRGHKRTIFTDNVL